LALIDADGLVVGHRDDYELLGAYAEWVRQRLDKVLVMQEVAA
jgi:hypothetical protein